LSNRISSLLADSPSVDRLRSPDLWSVLLADEQPATPPRWRRIGAYRQLVASGAMADVVSAYAWGSYRPGPPVRHHLNKAGGKKKVVYTFAAADELLFKGLNLALRESTESELSPLCHSFRPGRGPRSAYRMLRWMPDLDRLACLHVDVRDFFNSIPVDRLLRSLPRTITGDAPLMHLLVATLSDTRVIADGSIVHDGHKGVMAGTPLAPMLSNLYLRPLDAAFESSGVPYVRYADDVVVFAPISDVDNHLRYIAGLLNGLGLELNTRKTRVSLPGQSWEFLGFRYSEGRLDVAPNTAAKLRRRVRRIARRACGRQDACEFAVRRLNRRLYGVGGRRADFTWAGWFFPLLTTDVTLRSLDRLVQGQLRFAVTGRHEQRSVRTVPYSTLRESGYLPLVAAFYRYRAGKGVLPSERPFDTIQDRTCVL
jgi:RNA-directed DNA polymerase